MRASFISLCNGESNAQIGNGQIGNKLKLQNLCRERQRAAPRGRRGAPRPKGGAEQLGAMTHVPIAVSTTPLDRRPHGGCCTNFAGSKLWHRSVDRPPKLQSCWQGWLHLWLCVLPAMHITLQVRTAGSQRPAAAAGATRTATRTTGRTAARRRLSTIRTE